MLHPADFDVTANIRNGLDEQIGNENETRRSYDVPRYHKSLGPIALSWHESSYLTGSDSRERLELQGKILEVVIGHCYI
jgi:hypothetical protein